MAFTTFVQIYSPFAQIFIIFALIKFEANTFFRPNYRRVQTFRNLFSSISQHKDFVTVVLSF